MNAEKYLRRIGVEKTKISANLQNLKLLQRQNLLNIPFENLDIHWKRPIRLDNEKFYQKVVDGRRGGFCYELNGLFFNFLSEIGYKGKIISARVSNSKDNFGAEYDHLAILTRIEGKEYLTDVGFGDFVSEPLEFVLDIEQSDENGVYRITKYDKEYFLVAKKDASLWHSEYIFKDKIRDLSEFREMCNFHQTSPESHFTRGKVCSLMTETGRKTLTDKKFIQTKNARKTEVKINSDEDFAKILRKEFGIKA